MMKRSGASYSTATATATATATRVSMFLVFVVAVFFIHQITLSSISSFSSSSLSNSTLKIQEKVAELKSGYHRWAPPEEEEKEPNNNGPASTFSEPIICDTSHDRYDLCYLNGPTVIDPLASTLSILDPTNSETTVQIRPYPRKWEKSAMSRIKELTLVSSNNLTHCEHRYDAPAVVFSTGGYTGNLFHDFNDGFIPLFLTIRSMFHNRDVVLVVVNSKDWWVTKYAELLRQFSPYPIVNIDTHPFNHCFSSASVGLISHGYMTIEPKLLPKFDTFLSFRALIGKAYDTSYTTNNPSLLQRPRLVLVSRFGNVGRVILNQAEVKKAAEELGFEVILFEPTKYTPMSEAYKLINTSHVMLGVHGAALTHSLFLRPGSVFIQIVPIGIDWLAETCFGKSARDIGLEYMEYKIEVNESTLLEKYGKDDLVLRDPRGVVKQNFSNTKKIYLKNQDVRLDLVRVVEYLRTAYYKAVKFMEREG